MVRWQNQRSAGRSSKVAPGFPKLCVTMCALSCTLPPLISVYHNSPVSYCSRPRAAPRHRRLRPHHDRHLRPRRARAVAGTAPGAVLPPAAAWPTNYLRIEHVHI